MKGLSHDYEDDSRHAYVHQLPKVEPTYRYSVGMATKRSFGDRTALTVRLSREHYELFDNYAEQEGLSLGAWIAKELAVHRDLEVPSFVGRTVRYGSRKGTEARAS
ncbi:hypothetical protein [Glutamicibacter soli]